MVHNQYGTLQAKAYSSVSTKRQLILSDSLGLGGGKYAVKSVYVQGDEDHADLIDQMVSTVIWYGMIGMNVIVRLQDGVEDTRLIKHYHLLNTFLPFTAVHEEALLTLDIDTRATIRAFMTTKLEFYPEWMKVLHLAESLGIPPVTEVSDRFPDYGVLAQGGSEVNSTRRFLIGEKILVAYDMTDGGMPLTVRLPEQSGRSWYHYGDDRFYHKVTGNTVVKEDHCEPMKHYFIASPGILVRSQIDSVDSDMELIKSASLDITIFAGDPREDEFGSWSDSYLLIEGDDDELHLEITVTHNSGGISLVIEPVVKGDGSDARRWGTIQFAEGSLQGIFQGVMMNGVELNPMCYLYHPESDWLGIYMNNDFEENPSLHTRYEINVLYR